jgi:hypothetical protein
MSLPRSQIILISVITLILVLISGATIWFLISFKKPDSTSTTNSTVLNKPLIKPKIKVDSGVKFVSDLTPQGLEFKEVESQKDEETGEINTILAGVYKSESVTVELRAVPIETKFEPVDQKSQTDLNSYLDKKFPEPRTAANLFRSPEFKVGAKEDLNFLRMGDNFSIPKFNGRFYLAKANNTNFHLIGLSKTKNNYYLLFIPLKYEYIANQVSRLCATAQVDLKTSSQSQADISQANSTIEETQNQDEAPNQNVDNSIQQGCLGQSMNNYSLEI